MIMFMRIDRLLCEMNIGTRSQVKELIRKGMVLADGQAVKKPDAQVDEATVRITCQGKDYTYSPYVYFMMNKPPGVITATEDAKEKTVLDLLREQLAEGNEPGGLGGVPIRDIFPVGRLDKDTVGLLLLTNDGALAHKLLSPKKHVPKQYFVTAREPLTEEMAKALEEGVFIGKEEKTRPARILWREDCQCRIVITEGKYHQIKRMFHGVGTEVVYLKRLSMGSLYLDEGLKEGQIRELTKEEVMNLCSGI